DLRERGSRQERHPGSGNGQVAKLHRTSKQTSMCEIPVYRKAIYGVPLLRAYSNSVPCSFASAFFRLSGLPTTPNTSTLRSDPRGTKIRCWLLKESGGTTEKP